jgi:hypothetical protein
MLVSHFVKEVVDGNLFYVRVIKYTCGKIVKRYHKGMNTLPEKIVVVKS